MVRCLIASARSNLERITLIPCLTGTVFAYGQTSSGKTHTMEGPDRVDPEMQVRTTGALEKYPAAD